MKQRQLRISAIAILLATGLTGSIAGPAQLRSTAPSPETFDRSKVPVALQPYVIAMGERIWRAGGERVILDGEYTDARGTSTARVTLQLPGLVRLEGVRADGSVILFDGQDARAGGYALNDTERRVLDAFAVDSIEAATGRASHGADVRMLGRGFSPDPEAFRNGTGPAWDVVEITGPLPTRADHPVGTRRYYFNTRSRLLESVRYILDGQFVETRFSGWAELNGSMYPARIERFRNDAPVFAFTTLSAGAGAGDDTTIFRAQ